MLVVPCARFINYNQRIILTTINYSQHCKSINQSEMSNTKNSLIAGLAFGAMLGLFFMFLFDVRFGFVAGSISGLLFGLAIYFFTNSKAIDQQTKIEGLQESDIVFSGGANHFVNAEAVGGKLYLTKASIQFKSHGMNIQNHGLEIPLKDISQIKFFNTLGLIPNGLAFVLHDGHEEKLVVGKRTKWRDAIHTCVNL